MRVTRLKIEILSEDNKRVINRIDKKAAKGQHFTPQSLRKFVDGLFAKFTEKNPSLRYAIVDLGSGNYRFVCRKVA